MSVHCPGCGRTDMAGITHVCPLVAALNEASGAADRYAEALRVNLPVIEDAYFGGNADDLFAAEGALRALRAALGEARSDDE